MNLYEFQLPDKSNNGLLDYRAAREEFVHCAADMAGGSSYRGQISGHWIDETDALVSEPMHVLHVSCDDKTASELRALFFDLFPDQKALFCAVIGEAQVFAREKAAA
jgi:hypothetical protein